MKAGKFADTVNQILGENDKDFSVDTRVILTTAEMVIASTLSSYVRNSVEIPDGFYVPYIFPLTYDPVRGRKLVIPSPSFVNITGGMGIRNVGPTGDDTVQYIALKSGALGSIQALEVATMGGKIGYWNEGNKIMFAGDMDPNQTEVLVIMIPRISEVDEDEEVFSTDEVEHLVATSVANYLLRKANKPEDKTNDNVSN